VNELEPSQAVLDALASGRKIEAIKLLREEQGLSLKDAKEAVERLPGNLVGEPRPVGPQAGQEDRGVTRMIVILAVLAILIVGLYLL
jgi:hypothetical protein